VSVDLVDIRSSAVVGEDDVDLDGLPWPDTEGWLAAVASSPLVSTVDAVHRDDPADDGLVRPVRLSGSALYLDRYWRDEVALAGDLLARAGTGEAGSGAGDRSAELERFFPGAASADQRSAAANSLARKLTVIAGGPGTGKTTTVARLLALLCEQALADGRRPPLVALAAPTGKAAARMEEAVRHEAAGLETAEPVRAVLSG
jgi:exodeoxyribonuclease V alpha subunit